MRKSQYLLVGSNSVDYHSYLGTAERDIFEYDLRMDIIGTMIKQARLKRKMPQGDLGKILGVQKSQI